MSATLLDLMRDCDGKKKYNARYCHDVPEASSVNRAAYLVEKCRGQRVLSLGGSGPMDDAIQSVADAQLSVDIVSGRNRFLINLDLEPERVLDIDFDTTLVLCGEILEHLSNPGRLLDVLRRMNKPMIVTAPNAFTDIGRRHLTRGVENVNPEHVCYYSYKTLKKMLERHGFKIVDSRWYNGRPFFAEGVIFEVD